MMLMLSYKRISILVLIFSFMIMIGLEIEAHNVLIHDAKNIHLFFTGLPKTSCNIDGVTFTNSVTKDADDNVLSSTWDPEPIDPVVSITAEAHGWGYAHILFYGNIDGIPFGNVKNTVDDKLGSWGSFVPFGRPFSSSDHEIKVEYEGSFDTDPGEYPWDASGSITLVPWYWKWRISGIIPGGSWEQAPSDFHSSEVAEQKPSGSWTVELDEQDVPSVSFNETDFFVRTFRDEILKVTIKKDDLNYASMYMDDELRNYNITDKSDSEVVLWRKLTQEDLGYYEVSIYVNYGEDNDGHYLFYTYIDVKGY